MLLPTGVILRWRGGLRYRYVYDKGELLVVHYGPCKDIDTIEGRFIHQMEHGLRTKRFRTKDPLQAHAFLMPFNMILMVKYLYRPLSYDLLPLKKLVPDYVRLISTEHPFWNKTQGANHFTLSCHDWGLVDMLLLVCAALSALKISLADTFDVTQYGAVGDGKTDDTQAFLKAWDATCGAGGGSSTLVVPSDKSFFLKPLVFMGSCKSSSIRVQIDGTLVAPTNKGAWRNCASNTWIVFKSVDGLKIDGTGTLDAKGSAWWSVPAAYDVKKNVTDFSNGGECNKPTTFRLIQCNSAQLTGLHFLNSGGNHISIDNCKSLDIHKINIKAPESSPNTDGIDLYDSSHVMISNSFIETGDDCIAIKNKCFHVNISDITCGPGHGISVGSLEGSDVAVEGIYVQRCTFIGTQASARIKTWPGGSGYARNIFYDHLTLDSVKSAIEINQHYTERQDKLNSAVQVSEVHFTNVQGSAEKIRLECSPDVPCDNIIVEQVTVTSSSPGKQVDVTCENAKVDSSAVTPKLPC